MNNMTFSEKDRTNAYQAIEAIDQKGWDGLSDSDLKNLELKTKDQLITLIVNFIDDAWEKQIAPFDPKVSGEDQLFDLLFTRFEIMKPYKNALCTIAEACQTSPQMGFVLYRSLLHFMQSTLEHATNHERIPSAIQTHTLLGIYLLAFYKWATDKSDDLSTTMATLNTTLQTCKKYITLI